MKWASLSLWERSYNSSLSKVRNHAFSDARGCQTREQTHLLSSKGHRQGTYSLLFGLDADTPGIRSLLLRGSEDGDVSVDRLFGVGE